jgi:hypothetical protein
MPHYVFQRYEGIREGKQKGWKDLQNVKEGPGKAALSIPGPSHTSPVCASQHLPHDLVQRL